MELLERDGGMVKAAPDGRVFGYVIKFTDSYTPDLTGEFFDARTDLGLALPAKVGLYYNHGLDETLGRKRLAHAEAETDEIGVWFTAQLDLANKYAAAICELAKMGKLGASSGAPSHLVEKRREGKSVHLASWPLAEISLTPNPAEPGCRVSALKTLMREQEWERRRPLEALRLRARALIVLSGFDPERQEAERREWRQQAERLRRECLRILAR